MRARAGSTLVFAWNTTGVPSCKNYTLWAEASGVTEESVTENNIVVDGVVKIKIMGDIDDDGVVNIKDLAAIARLFDKGWNFPEYDVYCDLNRDSQINIVDIAIAAKNFGESCL